MNRKSAASLSLSLILWAAASVPVFSEPAVSENPEHAHSVNDFGAVPESSWQLQNLVLGGGRFVINEIGSAYTLESSADAALRQNSSVRAADEKVIQAEADYGRLRSLKNIRFNISNKTTWQNKNTSKNVVLLDSLSNQLTASLGLLITTFGKIEKETAAVYLKIGAAAMDADAVKRRIAWEAKDKFFNCMRSRALGEAAYIHLETCRKNLEDVNSVSDSAAKNQAELQLAEAGEQVKRSLGFQKDADAEFLNVLEERAAGEDPDDLKFSAPKDIEIDSLCELEDLQETALRRRNEILSAERCLEAARELVEAEKCSRNPELGVSADYILSPGYHTYPSSMYLLNLHINWEAWDGGMREQKLIELYSQIRALEACRDKIISDIFLETRKAWTRFNLSCELLETSEDRAEAAWKYFVSAKEDFLNNKGSYFEVRKSADDLNAARQDYVNAFYEKEKAFVYLEYCIGYDFPDRRLEISKDSLKEEAREF